LGVESDKEDQPHQQGSRQGDIEEGIVGDDDKIPALMPDPRNQNPFAALADDSGEETPRADASHHNSPDDVVREGTHTYASVASSSSGSANADDQPGWTTMTNLSGMRQKRSAAGKQAHKRERTRKIKSHTPATPNTVASVGNDVCGAMLSPIVGQMYEHNLSYKMLKVSPV